MDDASWRRWGALGWTLGSMALVGCVGVTELDAEVGSSGMDGTSTSPEFREGETDGWHPHPVTPQQCNDPELTGSENMYMSSIRLFAGNPAVTIAAPGQSWP